MSDGWENKEIAMASIFTLVGKSLLYFLFWMKKIGFFQENQKENCLILPIDRMSIMIFHFPMLHCFSTYLKIDILATNKEMFFIAFCKLLQLFFAKLYNSKKDFINWSGQDYLLCLESTDFPTNMKPILFRIIHADNHPELFFSLQ